MRKLCTCSLQERLASHTQYRKAEAVELLSKALRSAESHRDTPDVGHKILLLLYQTSNSPLNAAFQPSEAVQQLLLDLKGSTDAIIVGIAALQTRSNGVFNSPQ